MTENRPLKVFLCHSSADKPAVRELYQKLRAEPWIQPWLDKEELFPGMDWNMEIEKAIEATDVILVCLSNNSITKEGFVQKEIRIALDYADYKPEGALFIIPVRLEECTPPKRLARWQYADYFEGQRERGLERLLISLKRRSEVFTKEQEYAHLQEAKSGLVVRDKPDAERKRKIAEFYVPLIRGGQWQLLALHLTEHPEDVAAIAQMLSEQSQGEMQNQLGLLKIMLDEDTINDVQLDDIRKRVLHKLVDNLDT